MVTLSIDNKELIDHVMSKEVKEMTIELTSVAPSMSRKSRGSQLRRGIIDDKFPVDYYVVTLSYNNDDGGGRLLQVVDNSILTIKCSDGNIDFNAREQALHNLFKQWTYRTKDGKIAKENLYDKYIRYGYSWKIFLVNDSLPFIDVRHTPDGQVVISPIVDKTTGKIVILGGQNK